MTSPKKLIAAVTGFCFLFTSILSPALEASVSPRPTTVPAPETAVAAPLIPANLGSITAEKNLDPRRIVILIQDMHCQGEVQKNISAIIGALDKKYSLDHVYVEGACGVVDTSWVAGIPSANVQRAVAVNLMEAGRLTGAEHYAITAGKTRFLRGLEDEKEHSANIIRLGAIMDRQKEFSGTLAQLDEDMAVLRGRYLGRKNRKLIALVDAYRSREISARKYYTLLIKFAEQVNARPADFNALFSIRMTRYPTLTTYVGLLDSERRLQYSRIRRQLPALLAELRAAMPVSAFSALVKTTGNLSDGELLYSMVDDLARQKNIDLARRYPDLARFLDYRRAANSVNPLELIREERRLVEELRIACARDVSEADITFLCDFYDIFKDYLSNRLSADDYAYFTSRFGAFQSLWSKYNYTNHLTALEAAFPLLNDYYRVNDARSQRFVENMLSDDDRSSVSVMVAGGFHSAEVQKLLEQRGISYRTITPKVDSETSGAGIIYRDIVHAQAAAFSHSALSYRLFTQMDPQVLPTSNNGFAVRFKTGEYIEVSRDGNTISMKSIQPPVGAAEDTGWVKLSDAVQYGALRAQSVALEQLGLFRTVLSGPDVMSLTALMYFLARKGWLEPEGLTFEADQSAPDVIAVALNELARAIEKKSADLNDLARLPGFVQNAVLDRVERMKRLDRSTPDFIRAVDDLYSALITLNSRLEYRATGDREQFAKAHPAVTPRSMASSWMRLLSLTYRFPRVNIALHDWWNKHFWGTVRMLSLSEASQVIPLRGATPSVTMYGYDFDFPPERHFLPADIEESIDLMNRRKGGHVVVHDSVEIPHADALSDKDKEQLQIKFEERQRLLAANTSVLDFMSRRIADGALTRSDARTILALTQDLIKSYLQLSPRMRNVVTEKFKEIESRLTGSWHDSPSDNLQLTADEMQLLTGLDEAAEYTYQIYTVHQFINFLHQQGLAEFDGLAADIVPSAGQRIRVVGTNPEQSIPLIVVNAGDTPLAAGGHLRNRIFKAIINGTARTQYGVTHVSYDDLANPRQDARMVVKDTFVSFSNRIGYHSTDCSAELADPDAGGYFRITYADAGTFPTGTRKRLEYFKRVLEHIGMSVTVKGNHMTAILDKDHGAISASQIEYAVFLFTRLTWFSKYVDNAFESNKFPYIPTMMDPDRPGQPLRDVSMLTALFLGEEVIPFGLAYDSSREDHTTYLSLGEQRAALRGSLNKMLQSLGLRVIPDNEPFGQRLINLYYNDAIRAALARGEVRLTADGSLEKNPDYAPVAAMLAAVRDNRKAQQAAGRAAVLNRLVDPVGFETIGSIGGLVCGRAQMELMNGEWLVLTALINPQTARVLYAWGGTKTDATALLRPMNVHELEALFTAEYLPMTDDEQDSDVLNAWGEGLLRSPPPAGMENKGGQTLRAEVVSPGRKRIVTGAVTFDKQNQSGPSPIFITPYTTPDDIDIIAKAGAVVTTGGGKLSHMAITTRELGVPGVIVREAAWIRDSQGRQTLRMIVQRPENPALVDGYWVSMTAETQVVDIHEGDMVLVDTVRGEVSAFTGENRENEARGALAARNADSDATRIAARPVVDRQSSARAESAASRTEDALIYRLKDIDASYAGIVGGKSAMLGAIAGTVEKHGGTVPDGFAVTTLAFKEYLKENDPQGAFEAQVADLEKSLSEEADEATIQTKTERVRQWLNDHPITAESVVGQAILNAFEQQGMAEGRVAVRSSAVQEDTSEAAFAGAAQTHLYVTREQVLEKVNECWQSFWLPRGVLYRANRGMGQRDVSPAVTIQTMVDADVSGIVFTRDPVTGENTTVIAAAYGLGEGIVGGLVDADEYRVNPDGKYEEPRIGYKSGKIIQDSESSGTKYVPLHTDSLLQRKLQRQQALTDSQISKLAALSRELEASVGYPLDIEFSIQGGRMYFLQARPMTSVPLPASNLSSGDRSDTIDNLAGISAPPNAVLAPTTESWMSASNVRKLESATAMANRFVADVDLPVVGVVTPVNALRGASLYVLGHLGRAPPGEFISVDLERNAIYLQAGSLDQLSEQQIGDILVRASIMLAAQQSARKQSIPWTGDLANKVSNFTDNVIRDFSKVAEIDAARAIDVTREGFAAIQARDVDGTIFDIDDGSARGTIYQGQGAVAYLQEHSGQPFTHETTIVIPEGSSIIIDDQLVDHEGAVYIPAGGSARLNDFKGPLYIIQMTQIPQWYVSNRFSRETFPQTWEQTNGFNSSGIIYKNTSGVTIFKLSERKNVWTGQDSEWLLDSVSGDERSVVGPLFGISMVNYEMGDGADFHLMRPAEWLHNHPSHDDAFMTEIYVCLSGTMEVVVYRDDQWYVNKLTPGMIMVMGSDIDHAVIKGSGHYKHIAVQFPSTFQYGFAFSDKHTPLAVLHANVPTLYNALWRVESDGLNYLGSHQDSTVPVADKRPATRLRWRSVNSLPIDDAHAQERAPGSGFGLSTNDSIEHAIAMRPRLLRMYESMPDPGKAVIEALAAVFLVPSIEADEIAGAVASESVRDQFLRAHDDPRRSARFNTTAGRVRIMGLKAIAGMMHIATPFGPVATRWANIGTHMAFNAFAVPSGIALSRSDASRGGKADEEISKYLADSHLGEIFDTVYDSGDEARLISYLNSNAAGVMTIQDFIVKHYSDMSGGYSLGMHDYNGFEIAFQLSDIFGMTSWEQNDYVNTEQYLARITGDAGKPIIFFVPPDVRRDGVTKDALVWLARHPDRMRNVYFVLGAYDRFFPLRILSESLDTINPMSDFVVNFLSRQHPQTDKSLIADVIHRNISQAVTATAQAGQNRKNIDKERFLKFLEALERDIRQYSRLTNHPENIQQQHGVQFSSMMRMLRRNGVDSSLSLQAVIDNPALIDDLRISIRSALSFTGEATSRGQTPLSDHQEIFLDDGGKLAKVVPATGLVGTVPLRNEEIDHFLLKLFEDAIQLYPNADLKNAYFAIRNQMGQNAKEGHDVYAHVDGIVKAYLFPALSLDFAQQYINNIRVVPFERVGEIDPLLQHIRILSSGQYGILKLVSDTRNGSLSVIKMARPADRASVVELQKEIDTYEALRGVPQLARVLAVYGSNTTHPSIRMEYLEGYATLKEYGKEAFLNDQKAQAALALFADECSRRGYVIIDLNPENFLINLRGDVKVVDISKYRKSTGGADIFALNRQQLKKIIAAIPQKHPSVNTPQFAPGGREQARKGAADGRAEEIVIDKGAVLLRLAPATGNEGIDHALYRLFSFFYTIPKIEMKNMAAAYDAVRSQMLSNDAAGRELFSEVTNIIQKQALFPGAQITAETLRSIVETTQYPQRATKINPALVHKRFLGEGKNGVALRVHDTRDNVDKVLKVPRAGGQSAKSIVEEKNILAQLSSNNIPALARGYDLLNPDGTVDRTREAILMEYVQGPSLQDYLDNGWTVPASVRALLMSFAQQMTAAGYVIRDLHEGDIFPDAGKIIDVGAYRQFDSEQESNLLAVNMREVNALLQHVHQRQQNAKGGPLSLPALKTSRGVEKLLRSIGAWFTLPAVIQAGVRVFDEQIIAPWVELPRFVSLLALSKSDTAAYAEAVDRFFREHGYTPETHDFYYFKSGIADILKNTTIFTVFNFPVLAPGTIAQLVVRHARYNINARKDHPENPPVMLLQKKGTQRTAPLQSGETRSARSPAEAAPEISIVQYRDSWYVEVAPFTHYEEVDHFLYKLFKSSLVSYALHYLPSFNVEDAYYAIRKKMLTNIENERNPFDGTAESIVKEFNPDSVMQADFKTIRRTAINYRNKLRANDVDATEQSDNDEQSMPFIGNSVDSELLAKAIGARMTDKEIEEFIASTLVPIDALNATLRDVNEATTTRYSKYPRVEDIDNNLRYERILSSGRYGIIILVLDKRDNEEKILKVPNIDPLSEQKMRREITILKDLKGTPGLVNIIKFYNNPAILMDYVRGASLFEHVAVKRNGIPESLIKDMLAYGKVVAKRGYYVHDLHLGNVMINEQGNPVFIDVGEYQKTADEREKVEAVNESSIRNRFPSTLSQGSQAPAAAAILQKNAGPHLLLVGRLRRFMPVRWAQVIGLAVVHAKEYSWLKRLMNDDISDEKMQQIAGEFDMAHGTANAARRTAILAMGKAGRGIAGAFDFFGLAPHAAFIASGIAHVKYDLTTRLPMAFIVSETGIGLEDARVKAVENGLVPVIVQPLPRALTGKAPRSAGMKNVWARMEDGTLVMYIKAPDSDTFRRMAADVIGTVRGSAHVRGATLPVRILSDESRRELDGEKMVVYDDTGAGVPFPGWLNVDVLTDSGQWGPWEAMSNAHQADTVARSPEIGLELAWSDQLGKTLLQQGRQINQSLFFTVASIEDVQQLSAKDQTGTTLIQQMQSRGAKVYAIYHGTSKLFAQGLIDAAMHGFDGVVCTDPALKSHAVSKAALGGKGGAGAVAEGALVNLKLDSMPSERELSAVKPGSVVRVQLGTDTPAERVSALNALPSSTIVVFVGSALVLDGIARDTTNLSVAGVNLLDLLRFTPRSREELANHQRKVADELAIDTFEHYGTAADAEREFSALAAGNFSAVTKNTLFIEAVRLHARRVDDAGLRKEFLNAVAARLRALQVLGEAGKSGGLADRRLERILAEMIPLAHTASPIPAIMDRVAERKNDENIKQQHFSDQLFIDISALQLQTKSNPQAARTVIELIKLYAEQRMQFSLSSTDTALTGTAAAKAILEAA